MTLLAGVVRWLAGGFYGFLGPRMPEDPREWETERGFRAEAQGRGGGKETEDWKVAEF
jgi:hypothetical protein